MIEMISGCTRIGSHVVTPADGPFITVKEIEEHLVGIGVARYVDAAPAPVPAADEIGPEPSASRLLPCWNPFPRGSTAWSRTTRKRRRT